jgi:hypothetical protein
MSNRMHMSGFIVGVTAMVLAACGGEYADGAPPLANPQSPIGRPVLNHGYHAGLAVIDGVSHFADAIITTDGIVRIYVGGPYETASHLDLERPAHSVIFEGSVRTQDLQTHALATGTGVVIGQTCTPPDVGRFCAETGTAELSATIANGSLAGTLRVSSSQSTEVWTLQLAAWPVYYEGRAFVSQVGGQYLELHGEFAAGTRTVISVDSGGRLFFQSPGSRCVGNGTVTPHANGQFGVFDVVLRIESCAAERAYLNGEYGGLLVTTPSDYWNYDAVLRMWLTTSGSPRVALSSLSAYIY